MHKLLDIGTCGGDHIEHEVVVVESRGGHGVDVTSASERRPPVQHSKRGLLGDLRKKLT